MSRSTATVDPHTLLARLGDDTRANPVLIDVRTPAEYEAAHLPGAVNVPLNELTDRLDDLCGGLRDQDVVVVCRSGARAGQAAETLRQAGLTRTEVLAGGIAGWERSGGPVNRGRQVWDLERQVRFAAGSLVLTGILGSGCRHSSAVGSSWAR